MLQKHRQIIILFHDALGGTALVVKGTKNSKPHSIKFSKNFYIVKETITKSKKKHIWLNKKNSHLP